MVSPATCLAERIDVTATEKIRLHIHLLQFKTARLHLLLHVLMTRIKPTRVTAHRHQTTHTSLLDDRFCTRQTICQWNFYLYMFTCTETGKCLLGMQLCRRTQDNGIDFWQRKTLFQFSSDMCDPITGSDVAHFFTITTNEGDDFNAWDQSYAIQMFNAKSTSTSQRHFDRFCHYLFSRIR